ncbi:transporter [Sporanaerobium hydrogeniformans]|uniref:Transporter n=1 Tax=Sporanaerobium hydrogeniformans TaxID=3072179 RepID=A0AC61DFI5_9FIRM|nr:hemolysin family protein [Sporanaerobium hydrogeniformans]PHV71645.1 transporter [Sporanaerobium hydrogeniformans]
MSSSDIGTLGLLSILILMSAYFSATETAFSSLNRIRLKNMAGKGNKRAALALKLSEDYDQVLSSILIGNNIVNIASASIATVFFTKTWGDAAVTLSTIITTVVVLIFGEICPKSIAKDMPERFAILSAPILNVICYLLTPLNFLFKGLKKLINKLLNSKEDRGITEEEILTLVEEAQSDGGINKEEGELIRSAIEFNDLDAVDVFTPRVDVVAVEETATREEVKKAFMESGYSRLPVYRGDIDNIIGIINEKDFYNKVVDLNEVLDSIIAPPIFVAPTIKISHLMKLLQQKQSHIAIIVDEYGGTKGIVTLEDIIEELVGEIWDEHDEVVSEIIQVSENEYKVLGSANVEKVFRELNRDEEMDAMSINGWVFNEFSAIPEEGDSFQYKNLKVVVLKMEERRVLEVSITVYPENEE